MDNNNEEKEYYKISEIIVGLRDYLREEYKILNEMLSLIDIDSDVPYTANIKIVQDTLFSNYDCDNKDYNGEIYLFISKAKLTPARLLREYNTRFIEDLDARYSIDHADYIIKKKDDDFIFDKRYKNDIPRTYKPILSIVNKDKFAKLYKVLEDNGYLSSPDNIGFFGDGLDCTFSISAQGIHFEEIEFTNSKSNNFFVINYDPSNDSLLFKDNRKNNGNNTNILISKDDIYEGYVSIIDKNKDKKDDLVSMIKFDNKSENNEKGKCLLKRKRNK